jgi:hypothetical protein
MMAFGPAFKVFVAGLKLLWRLGADAYQTIRLERLSGGAIA